MGWAVVFCFRYPADLCILTPPKTVLERGAGPMRLEMGKLPWLKITVMQLGVFP